MEATAAVVAGGSGDTSGFDGVVEAVRQTVVAAQVSGAIVALVLSGAGIARIVDLVAAPLVKAGALLPLERACI